MVGSTKVATAVARKLKLMLKLFMNETAFVVYGVGLALFRYEPERKEGEVVLSRTGLDGILFFWAWNLAAYFFGT